MTTKTITLSVFRYDPDGDEEPRLQPYEVPYRDDMVVLDALNWIKTHVDGSVNYRWSCRMGICGSCGMNVNGYPKLGCSAFLRDYLPGPIVVEPLNNFPVLRDLVIDMDSFLEKLRWVKPWIVRRETALARRYDLDSRDQAGQERLRTITGNDAVWSCSYVGECSAVCPKDVDPAKAIQ